MAKIHIDPKYYEIAQKNGISSQLLYNRVRTLHWDVKKAATVPPKKMTNREKWLEIARKNGIKAATFISRVNRLGWPEEKAATTPAKKKSCDQSIRGICISPEEYAAAERNGISPSTLYARVNVLRWDIKKAITTPVRQMSDHRYWAKIAMENGIRYETFRTRTVYYVWDPKKAATTPVMTTEEKRRHLEKIRVRKYNPELVALAQKNGISWGTYQARVTKLKWSEEKAATTPIVPPEERGRTRKRKLRELGYKV